MLVGLQPGGDVCAQRGLRGGLVRGVRRIRGPRGCRIRGCGEDHECLRDHQAVFGLDPHDRRLLYVRVLQQALLGFAGREPLPRDLEQVVGATLVAEVPIPVARHHVARNVPLPGERVSCGFGVLPVAVGTGPSAHAHPADLAGRHVAAVVVAEPHLEARDRGAESAGPDAAGPVRDEDVPHLGRPEAVEQFDAEGVVPAAVQRGGQGFAGRGRQPQTAQVVGARVRVRDHPVHHGGYVDEDGGAVAGDLGEELVGGAALRKEDGRGPCGEGEEEVRTGGVAEVQPGHREGDVVGRVAQYALRIALVGVGERRVALDHSLGAPGRPAGEKPDRGVVRM